MTDRTTMPKVVFTNAESARIQEILEELNPARHELTARFSQTLADEDWEFVQDYVRAKMRALLETGLTMRSAVDLARATQLVDEQAVRRNFLHALWTYNFSFKAEIEEAFMDVVGGNEEAPLYVAVEALIDLAEDRMFGTFEEAHARLLRRAVQ